MRRILLIPALIYPYLVALTLIGAFTNRLPGGNIFVLLIILGVLWLVGLPMTITYSILAIRSYDAKRAAKGVMILKLSQIPAYIVIFVFGIICTLTIFTIGISVVLIAFDTISLILSGIAMIPAAAGGYNTLGAGAVILGILGFVFCADVIAVVILYKKIPAESAK